MIDRQQLLLRARIETHVLEAFIAEEWLTPGHDAGGEEFTEADVARARLICDLRTDIGANDEAVSVILHLIDQLHGLRSALHEVLRRQGAPTRD